MPIATKPVFEDVEPWPGENKASAPPPKDHNRPPPEEVIPVEFREALLEDRADFLTVMERYIGGTDPETGESIEGAVDRAKCTNDDELGNCGKLVKALRAMDKHISDAHKRVKQPYLDAGRAVDAEKNALTGPIAVARAKVERLMNDYSADQLRKEREAQAKADAERRKLEELAKENGIEAALPPPVAAPVKEPVRTDGATVSRSTEWLCEVEDYAKAFRKVKDDAKVQEAIDAAIKRIVKATKGKAIPGVRIWEGVKTTSR